MDNRTVRLSREEWATLLTWINEHGYGQGKAPAEPLEEWQARTAPVSYQYAMIVEAACDHELSTSEPYCAKCSMLMEA